MKYFLLWVGVCLTLSAYSQQKFTLSGYVTDKKTGESLTAAAVAVKSAKTGALTNAYGFYSITLPADTYTVTISYLGYEAETRFITLKKNTSINFQLEPKATTTKIVTVKANSTQEEVDKGQMSSINIPIQQLKNIPVIAGEVDPLKVIQLLPGVKGGNEGFSGFYVRGGGPDQNLILLDEAIVYNASHLFGFFSVFNADALKGIELIKGGFPSKYGGRLSSVLDIQMKEGNNKQFHGAGGIGVIASRLTLEGPIIKDKMSFIVSGRRTYLDLFTRAINQAQKDNKSFQPIPSYYFYDLNAKINYKVNDKNRIFLSGYFGRDVFAFNDTRGIGFNFDLDWGNATGTLRWNRIISQKIFSNTTLNYSRYNYDTRIKFDQLEARAFSRIEDWGLKQDFEYSPNPRHKVRFGGGYIYHTFQPSGLNLNYDQLDYDKLEKKFGNEFGLYISDEWDLTENTKLVYGVRQSGFLVKDKFYTGTEPRVSIRQKFRKNDNFSIKAGYARMYQYLHLISSSSASLPTDVWYPTTENVKPQIADQVAAGFTQLFYKKQFALTVEGYYKWLQNQIEFKENAQTFFADNLEREITFGRGWSYGAEFLLQKKEGKTTGWIGYTLSWTNRQFDSLNFNKPFPVKYDRRHDISIVVTQELTKRWSVSVVWVYGTGNAVTLPEERYFVADVPGAGARALPVYSPRNNYRMPATHRLDLGVVYRKPTKWGESDLTFSVYNAYNRRNAFIVYIDTERDTNGNTTAYKPKLLSLFPIIPTVTYNFKF